MQSNTWLLGKDIFDKVPEGAYGFTYIIYIADRFYVGKKNFYSSRKIPKGKKELAQQDGRASKKKLVIKESNWKSYCSSSEEVKKLVLEGHVPKREILKICYSSKELTFNENKLLYNSIEKEDCLNKSIYKKFYKEEIMQWL